MSTSEYIILRWAGETPTIAAVRKTFAEAQSQAEQLRHANPSVTYTVTKTYPAAVEIKYKEHELDP